MRVRSLPANSIFPVLPICNNIASWTKQVRERRCTERKCVSMLEGQKQGPTNTSPPAGRTFSTPTHPPPPVHFPTFYCIETGRPKLTVLMLKWAKKSECPIAVIKSKANTHHSSSTTLTRTKKVFLLTRFLNVSGQWQNFSYVGDQLKE